MSATRSLFRLDCPQEATPPQVLSTVASPPIPTCEAATRRLQHRKAHGRLWSAANWPVATICHIAAAAA